jgi:diguanylate cyclase (GGDEF)-like protein
VERIGAARQEAQVLFELTGHIGSTLSLKATLSILASGLSRLVPYDGIAVYLKRGQKVQCEFSAGEDSRLFSTLEIPMGHGLSGWVVENEKPIVNGNPSVEPGYLNDPRKFSNLRSALAVPLQGVSGVIGALTLYNAEKDSFTRDHLRIVLALSSKLGVTIENNLKYQQAEHSAVLDFLTHLPNARALFVHLQSEVQACLQDGTPLTVLVGDLDGFKAVNDRLGHLEGNRLLQAVAQGLKQTCREQDYVARMGGDEFAIILRGAPPDLTLTMAARFQAAAVAAGKETVGYEAISLSLGEAVLGIDGQQPEELLAAADRRMYKAKRESKSRVQDLSQLADAVRTAALVAAKEPVTPDRAA